MNPARVTRAAGAIGLAVAAAVVSVATRSGGPGGYLIVLAVVSVALFVAGVVTRWTPIVAAGIAGLAATQVLGHIHTDDAPELVVVVGLLTGAYELGCWSTELVTPVADRPGAHLGRWAWVVGWATGGGLLAALVLGTSTVRIGGRVPLDLLAVLAVLFLLVAIAGSAVSFQGHGHGDRLDDVPERPEP